MSDKPQRQDDPPIPNDSTSLGTTAAFGRSVDYRALAQAEAQVSPGWNVGDVILDTYEVTGVLSEASPALVSLGKAAMSLLNKVFGRKGNSKKQQRPPSVVEGVYAPGALIADRYEVVKVLAGGMGIVYLSLDRHEDLPVALKTFKPEFLSDREARDRFLREGTVWIDLGRLPHIVRAYRVESAAHGLEVYLALEWVAEAEGMRDASLAAWLAPGKPLAIEQALLFALHIARGMKYATTSIPGLVHRDLKPANVLVGRDGNGRVTDFGLAKTRVELEGVNLETQRLPANSSRPQLTQGGMMGTPEYMAPEQFEPDGAAQASDIYAFGVTVYEMLAGQRPFQMPEEMHPAARGYYYRQAHQTEPVPSLSRGLPEGAVDLVMACLEKDPARRPRSFGEVEVAVAAAYRSAATKDAPGETVGESETRADRVAAGWSYNALGGSYQDIGKFSIAAEYFERVAHIGQVENEQRLAGQGLGNLGIAYYRLGDARRAIEFNEQALSIMREIGDRNGEGNALGILGTVHHDLGDGQRAIGFLEQALAIMRETGNRSREGAFLTNLGIAYRDLGDVPRAIGIYEQALANVREMGDRGGEGKVLNNLATAYRDLGDHKRAIGLDEQTLTIAREIGGRQLEGVALENLGVACRGLGDARRATGFLEQALAIAQEIGDRREIGNVLGELGNTYHGLGDLPRAIGFHEQTLSIAREIGDRRMEYVALSNLGMDHSDLGDVPRAIGFYEPALSITREMGHRSQERHILDKLGLAYHKLGDMQQAIGFLEQALVIARDIGNRKIVGDTSFNLALLLSGQGQREKALRHADSAAQAYAQLGDNHGSQQVQQLIAEIRRRGR